MARGHVADPGDYLMEITLNAPGEKIFASFIEAGFNLKEEGMKCPRCGREMTIGAAHSDGDAYQYECHGCGKIIPVSGSGNHPY